MYMNKCTVLEFRVLQFFNLHGMEWRRPRAVCSQNSMLRLLCKADQFDRNALALHISHILTKQVSSIC